jgi:membrane-associated HD superfamily phosphohydrolase
MILEPESYRSQQIQRRNNNLLCLAVVLFIIGIPFLQITWFTAVWWNIISIFNPLLFMILLLIGVVSTLSGVYIMWKWWDSGA